MASPPQPNVHQILFTLPKEHVRIVYYAAQGQSVDEIARSTGYTSQRIYQLLGEPKAKSGPTLQTAFGVSPRSTTEMRDWLVQNVGPLIGDPAVDWPGLMAGTGATVPPGGVTTTPPEGIPNLAAGSKWGRLPLRTIGMLTFALALGVVAGSLLTPRPAPAPTPAVAPTSVPKPAAPTVVPATQTPFIIRETAVPVPAQVVIVTATPLPPTPVPATPVATQVLSPIPTATPRPSALAFGSAWEGDGLTLATTTPVRCVGLSNGVYSVDWPAVHMRLTNRTTAVLNFDIPKKGFSLVASDGRTFGPLNDVPQTFESFAVNELKPGATQEFEVGFQMSCPDFAALKRNSAVTSIAVIATNISPRLPEAKWQESIIR